MPGKGVKWLSSWSPPDENIDNIARIELPFETQHELGCGIGEHVFLEYPWAYVTRDVAMRQACQIDSGLDVYKDKIEDYKAECLLVGYASIELISNSFVICLTEEARDGIVKRNREITKKILERVYNMIIKTGHDALSSTSEKTPERNRLLNNSRSMFEVEISLKINALSRHRKLVNRDSQDARDGYVDLRPSDSDKFNNMSMKQISKVVQTTLPARETYIQSYLGYPKNKWTQCNDSPDVESKEQCKEVVRDAEKPATHEESSPAGLLVMTTEGKESSRATMAEIQAKPQEQLQLNFFLQSHLTEILDYIGYNSKINMHSDDIENLMTNHLENSGRSGSIDYYLYEESSSLIDLSVSKGRVISDVSWHPNLLGLIAISYMANPRCNLTQVAVLNDCFDCDLGISVLIWSLLEPLRPKLLLNDPREIQTVSFCPSRHSVIVGGCTNGQLVLWDLCSLLNKVETSNLNDQIPMITASAASDPYRSHFLPIRAIRWLPPDCRINDDGTLNKLPEDVSMQFMTSSEDGTVAIWDLLWQPNLSYAAKNLKSIVTATMSLTDDLERLDGIFRPHYRLHVQLPKESFNLTVLDLCLPSAESYKEKDPPRKLWLGTAQGEIVFCTWHGQEFEVTGEETSDLLNRAGSVHDGPVIKIMRCHHLQDVLLTIGGRVFAIWRDDYLRRPILWRKRDCLYTACSWSDTPGVFVVARCDGNLETWDVCRKTRQPVHSQTISGKLITGLYTQDLWSSYPKFIGICDYNGTFRVTNEATKNKSNHNERIEWFRKFVDREVERKKEFHRWQDGYLLANEKALDRKAARVAEETKRRHQETREKYLKDQEDQARIKAEKKAQRIVPSKETVLWTRNFETMKMTLLEKKGFDPQKLDELRYPLVRQEEEKAIKMNKAKAKVAEHNRYFAHALVVKYPECHTNLRGPDIHVTLPEPVHITPDVIRERYRRDYVHISCEAKKILKENPRTPKFDWNTVMREGRRRGDLFKET